MSIILRREGQELLDGLGLDSYHFDINSNKNMVIVGECGKPLCNVKGVTFTRAAPPTAEIKYALELADAYLTKHLEVLKEVIKLSSYEDTLDMDPINTNYSTGDLQSIEYETSDFNFKLDSKGFLYSVVKIHTSATSIIVPKAILKEHDATVKQFEKRRIHLKKVKELTKQLNSCSI